MTLILPAVVFASSATDRKIEDAARESYNYRSVLENSVKVKANDGVVTLTGVVEDKDQRTIAEDTVASLPGVVSVTNEISVKPTHEEHSDGWIALKLRSKLLMSSHVSAGSTTVEVRDGIVTLKGTADNLAQKELTGVYAKEIKWVKSVRNEIQVVEKPSMKEAIAEKMDDASITSQVKYALLSHESTSALKTKVTTNDGTIVITGEASSDTEKALVTKLAKDVRGVKSVDNNMTIKM